MPRPMFSPRKSAWRALGRVIAVPLCIVAFLIGHAIDGYALGWVLLVAAFVAQWPLMRWTDSKRDAAAADLYERQRAWRSSRRRSRRPPS